MTLPATAVKFIKNVNSAILNPLIILAFTVALFVFLYGVFQFVRGGDSGESREEGRRHMFWGVFGLFIMISAFGIINLIANSIGVDTSAIKQVIPL